MKCFMFGLLVLLSTVTITAQEKEKSPSGDKPTKVKVYFAIVNVPEGMKAGDRVDLFRINGQTTTPNGVSTITTSKIVSNLEVASLKHVEKPKDKNQALEVELKATKMQIETIEKAKAAVVSVMQFSPNGQREIIKMPVPLRLEPATTGKK